MSLVSDFIINPVLRQARRFSRSSAATLDSDSEDKPTSKPTLVRESLPDETSTRSTDNQSPPVLLHNHVARESHLEASGLMQGQREIQQSSRLSMRLCDSLNSATLLSSPPESAVFDENVPSHVLTPPHSPTHNRSGSLPEDDGKGPLRKKILAVQSLEIPCEEKALLVHKLLTEGYMRTQKGIAVKNGLNIHNGSSSASWEQEEATGTFDALNFWQSTFGDVAVPQKFLLTAHDIKPTYCTRTNLDHPWTIESGMEKTERSLGCAHYRRNVKIQCSTCNLWYTCRFCHDAAEQHTLNRKETKHMLCMLCGCAQKASEACISCGELAATYYCSVCKLWDSDCPTYHCTGCGICRRGLGLGKDFFHCNVGFASPTVPAIFRPTNKL